MPFGARSPLPRAARARIIVRIAPDLQDIEPLFTFGRYGIAIVVLFADLVILHKLLAAGRR